MKRQTLEMFGHGFIILFLQLMADWLKGVVSNEEAVPCRGQLKCKPTQCNVNVLAPVLCHLC